MATEVAVRYQRDGKEIWVRGYEIFDPTHNHSTTKGFMPLAVKQARMDQVLTVGRGQTRKPIARLKSDVKAVEPGGGYLEFHEAFSAPGVASAKAKKSPELCHLCSRFGACFHQRGLTFSCARHRCHVCHGESSGKCSRCGKPFCSKHQAADEGHLCWCCGASYLEDLERRVKEINNASV